MIFDQLTQSMGVSSDFNQLLSFLGNQLLEVFKLGWSFSGDWSTDFWWSGEDTLEDLVHIMNRLSSSWSDVLDSSNNLLCSDQLSVDLSNQSSSDVDLSGHLSDNNVDLLDLLLDDLFDVMVVSQVSADNNGFLWLGWSDPNSLWW